MTDSKEELLLPVMVPTSGHSAPARALTRAKVARGFLTAVLSVAALAQLHIHLADTVLAKAIAAPLVKWNPCGNGLECTTISAPLDWHNSSDARTVQLAVSRKRADPSKKRLGSIFINPGGPGGSGSAYTHRAGPHLAELSGGQYDIVGFDPRGINETRPYVSCFDNALDEHLYQLTRPGALDLPVNFSSIAVHSHSPPNPRAVLHDLEAQVRLSEATFAGLYEKCANRSGEFLDFVGTEAVVRDIDHMAQLLDGPEAKINFWGLSYGTIVGQYLVAILPPERIGRVIIDGVVDWETWSRHTTKDFDDLRDIDRVFETFANACSNAGDKCALAHLGDGPAILRAIDGLIDALYHEPQPLLAPKNIPGLLVRSSHPRQALFQSAYSIKLWPKLADTLNDALKGNYSALFSDDWPAGKLLNLTSSYDELSEKEDSSQWSTVAIRCADQPAYSVEEPGPSAADIVEELMDGFERNSARVGDMILLLSWCKLWKPRKKSYFGGSFVLEEGALDTPVLVMSQTFDPVTPLDSAQRAMKNWGQSNARLIEQNGSGHCTISQASLATAKILHQYWAEGMAPEAEYTFTKVDELGFEPPKNATLSLLSVEDQGLLEAMSGLGEAFLQL